jgi:hypothetical protein
VAQEVLYCSQVAGVQISQGSRRVPQRMVGNARALQAYPPEVPVGLHADRAASQTLATPVIANGGEQRCPGFVAFNLPAQGHILFQSRGVSGRE